MIRRAIAITLSSAAIFAFAIALNIPMPTAQATAADSAESPAIPSEQIPKQIKDAVAAPDRPTEDKQLDAGRQPEQMLVFFGIAPGQKVADLFAGGGYTTELLSRVVGPTGKVYSQNPPFPERFKKIGEAYQARLKNPALKNVVPVTKKFDAPDLLPVPPGSLDAVTMNMNYHDMVLFKIDRDKVNAAVFKALRPGGYYDIVDHSAKDGSGLKDVALHRIDEKVVIDEIEKAGFKPAGASAALRHPDDDRTWNVFKKRGQTDRFMLKFEKP